MSTSQERLARVALGRLVEPGDPRLARLIAELGATEVHALLSAERDVGGMLTDVAARLRGVDPEADLQRGDELGLRYLIPGDPEWPASLDDLGHAGALSARGGPPLGLWAIGPLRLDALEASVAVVGSRSATTYGVQHAGAIAAEVGRAGHPIVSGAAFGIDQAAHRGALGAEAATIAVMAGGLDRYYPPAHDGLIRHIAEVGAVVSELPPGSAPTRHRFLARNRLIAALTRGTVVVEAAVRSGALNTANWADRLSRVLMGVPGPVSSACSEGVHGLIRAGAELVTDGRDVLELLGRAGEHLAPLAAAPCGPRDRLDGRQQRILEAVPLSCEAGVGVIARTAGIGAREVEVTLEGLTRRGLVLRGDAGWRLARVACERA